MKIAHIFADEKFESRGIKYEEFSKKNKIEVVPYFRKKDWSYFKYLSNTVNSLRKRKDIKIIHAHRISGFLPAIFVKLIRPRVRIIYDKHDIHPYDFIFDRLQFFADYTIVCSDLHLKHIRKFKKRSLRVSNYSDFKPISKAKRKAIRKEMKLKESDVLVLFQGSIVPNYGPDMLLNALPKINKKVKIGFIGWVKDQKYWNKLKKQFSDRVFYYGAKKYREMNAYVGSADVIVVLFQKSKLTLFGNPAKLFEAIACKIPVVVTNVECIDKYIKKYGNGIVVKNKDELAKAINKLTNKKVRESYARKSPNLKWSDEFKKYLKIIKNEHGRED